MLGQTLNNLAIASWAPAGEDVRIAALDEALGLADRGLTKHAELIARLHRAPLLLRLGQLDRFDSELAACRRLVADLSVPEMQSQVMLQEVGRATLTGDWEAAEERGRQAFELQRRTSLWGAAACWHWQLTTIRWAQGRLGEVVSQLVDDASNVNPVLRSLAIFVLAELGDHAEARRLIARWGVVIPEDWSTDFVLATWGEVAATLVTPDPSRIAARLLPYADRLVVAGTANTTWGSTRTILGRLSHAAGDPAAARQHLTAAIEHNESLGAVPHAARARRLLEELTAGV